MTVLPALGREPVPALAEEGRDQRRPGEPAGQPRLPLHGHVAAEGHVRPERAEPQPRRRGARRPGRRNPRAPGADGGGVRLAPAAADPAEGGGAVLAVRQGAAGRLPGRGRRRSATTSSRTRSTSWSKLTRRYPFQPLHQAIMRAVALGGALLLGADKDVSDEEVKILVQILHRVVHRRARDGDRHRTARKSSERLPEALEVVRKRGPARRQGVHPLAPADVALADGALMDAESALMLDLAKQLDIPTKVAYSIIVGSAQSVGFRTDVKLNRMAEDIRRSMMLGVRRESRQDRHSGYSVGFEFERNGFRDAPPLARACCLLLTH